MKESTLVTLESMNRPETTVVFTIYVIFKASDASVWFPVLFFQSQSLRNEAGTLKMPDSFYKLATNSQRRTSISAIVCTDEYDGCDGVITALLTITSLCRL